MVKTPELPVSNRTTNFASGATTGGLEKPPIFAITLCHKIPLEPEFQISCSVFSY